MLTNYNKRFTGVQRSLVKRLKKACASNRSDIISSMHVESIGQSSATTTLGSTT